MTEQKEPTIENADCLPEQFFDPDNVPERKPELICGVLRKGHKMILSAPSKAGKSFLMLELALAVAQGKSWIGIQCNPGKVIYANMEVDNADLLNRIADIRKTLSWSFTEYKNLVVLPLRGYYADTATLVTKLTETVQRHNADLLIIDPLYKILDGDENSAGDMAKLLRGFDVIMNAGCSLAIVHHYAKGGGKGRDQIDRASGSGVFSRDPDAIVTMTEYELTNTTREALEAPPGEDAFRLEFSLRSFPKHMPIGLWFGYPVHRVDQDLLQHPLDTTKERDYQGIFDTAFDVICRDHKLDTLAKACDVSSRTVRRWLESGGRVKGYIIDGGTVYRDTA